MLIQLGKCQRMKSLSSLSEPSFTTRRERVHDIIIFHDIIQHQIIKTYTMIYFWSMLRTEKVRWFCQKTSVLLLCGLLRGPSNLYSPILKGLNTFICIYANCCAEFNTQLTIGDQCADMLYFCNWIHSVWKKTWLSCTEMIFRESRDIICLYLWSKPHLRNSEQWYIDKTNYSTFW